MANSNNKVEENITGKFFVDKTCINCDACRKFAPSIFTDQGDYSFVFKQPENDEETFFAKQALLSCPVNSIGIEGEKNLKAARDSFPKHIDGPVYINGFNNEKTFGADSYFIKSDKGNWLIDSPRFIQDLVKKFEAMGGIKYIWISHKDDIGDSEKYAKHFGAKRIINQYDVTDKIKDAELVLTEEETTFDDGIVFHTPGHTKGSQVLVFADKYLFTGDHYAWMKKLKMFSSFHKYCWYSWEKQITSVDKMKKFKDIEWVLPGHGRIGQIKKGEFQHTIEKSVLWMFEVN
ncbi:MAG: MBL fold metallo-hydrolase [Epsilonproteobacteria bacterium]|nr:MAG: MBL fold metallo-hydrolase [Campylobacterota bacterium]RLA66050.1 MAG: MBL fold metallo-hydrolase [Campylobacterota bacterium]